MTTYIKVKREDYKSKEYKIVGNLTISNDKFNADLDNYNREIK